LQSCFARAQRNPGLPYAVLFLDIDGFKRVNDALGPALGDQILGEIAQRLSTCLQPDDSPDDAATPSRVTNTTLARLAGDQFAVLLESLRDPSDAMRIARRIQAVVAPFPSQDRELVVSASIGIALSSTLHAQPETLLQDADVAMRRAKTRGGSRCEVYDEAMHTRAEQRLKLEQELRAAFERNDFRLLYQPIFYLLARRIVALEALVRWHHPGLGVISPYQFLDIADDAGLILSPGKWILREACHQLHIWHTNHPALSRLSVTVNLSGKQLVHPHFPADVRPALQATGLAPSALQLELPEPACMADPKLTAEILPRLKHLGVGLSLGDFGTGQSFPWLRRFPLDELKIDRSLVHAMSADRGSADIIRLILTVARELNLKVVAEGVETAVQHSRLTELGCNFGQGFLFFTPLEADRVEDLLREQSLRLAFREESSVPS
jgi:diguanylate cyclase (GGDEF)-like protein